MKLELHHGTNKKFDKFDFKHTPRLKNDFWGGPVYFSDSYDIAVSYATAMKKQYGGEKTIYTVTMNFKKLFDVDDKFTGKNLTQFIESRELENFARGARLLNAGVDKYSVLAKLELGTMNLSGDQIFRGLSFGMVHTAKAREKLKEVGFDGLRYDGGLMGITVSRVSHSVYIPYYERSINIREITSVLQ